MVAGPNGAGKSSFVRERQFTSLGFRFVNADEIAKSLAVGGLSGPQLNLAAGRQMLNTLDALSARGRDMVVETTLSGRGYAERIPKWRDIGYRVELIYLSLPSADFAVQRVQQRVLAGGHDIPEVDIRRRFARSRTALDNVYKPLVDDWQVWDNSVSPPALLERWP